MSFFQFKKFNISDEKSAMKVGTDGVLLACWSDLMKTNTVLDVGTGCGLIPLVLAQKKENVKILGIDIHKESAEEAKLNFVHSTYSDRLFSIHSNFLTFAWENKFDKIISNPPFFYSAKKTFPSVREKARHQFSLKIEDLLIKAKEMLNDNGELDFIFPTDGISEPNINALGFLIKKECTVYGKANGKAVRKLYSLVKVSPSNQDLETEKSEIILESERGKRHQSYNKLTKDFYL